MGIEQLDEDQIEQVKNGWILIQVQILWLHSFNVEITDARNGLSNLS